MSTQPIELHVHVHVDALIELANQVSQLRTEMRHNMANTQEQLDAIIAQIAQGVQELRDEIARLAAANPAVDFTAAQALADALAGDNIPAVEPPAEPVV